MVQNTSQYLTAIQAFEVLSEEEQKKLVDLIYLLPTTNQQLTNNKPTNNQQLTNKQPTKANSVLKKDDYRLILEKCWNPEVVEKSQQRLKKQRKVCNSFLSPATSL